MARARLCVTCMNEVALPGSRRCADCQVGWEQRNDRGSLYGSVEGMIAGAFFSGSLF